MFSERQRKAILERDNNTSQMRHYSEESGFAPTPVEKCKACNGKGCGLQVHHIDPRRNGGGDTPDNLITLFACEHIGKKANGELADTSEEFVVHPDTTDALRSYRKGNKKAFQEMSTKRDIKLQHGEIYWNPDHDEEMKETAVERTQSAVAKGWKWPLKKTRG